MIVFCGDVEDLPAHTLCGEHYSELFAPHHPAFYIRKATHSFKKPCESLWKFCKVDLHFKYFLGLKFSACHPLRFEKNYGNSDQHYESLTVKLMSGDLV